MMASHFHYNHQSKLIKKSLDSLLEQTIMPDIYISLSFDNKYKKDIKYIIQKYGTRPNINFKLSKEKKYQMEHLFILNSIIIKDKYDLFMFCDDDDTYNNQRIEYFIKMYEKCLNDNIPNFGGVREIYKSDKNPLLTMPEYWAYGIHPDVISHFFSFFKEQRYMYLLKHKFADMYFRNYLRKNTKYLNWCCISEEDIGYKLYNYNINNPNSICGKIEQGEKNLYDNILLEIISYCNTDSNFKNIIKKYKISETKYIKIFTFIYDFCKLLYK